MRLYEQNAGVVVRKRKTAQALRGTAYPDFLMHYGIIGQKWGIRRFQNEDGTLTEEGKLRYNEGVPESETWRKNEAEHLTDAELRRRNNRLQMERQYKDLTTTESEREAKQRRREIINKVLVGTAVSLAAVAMRGHWKKAAAFASQFGKSLFTKLRTKISLKTSPNQLRSLGKQYSHAKGSVRNYRPGGAYGINEFRYKPKNYGGIPRDLNWPTPDKWKIKR